MQTTISNRNLEIANTIFQQLGGNKFKAMTGCKNFTSTDNGLSFHLVIRAKNSARYVKIILAPNDTYTMIFIAGMTAKTLREVDRVTDLFFDQLQEIFTDRTGIYCHL